MTNKMHGLSIGIQRVNNDVFLTLTAQGKLTHEDYEIITPMIDSALAEVKSPRVKVLIDATELEGWELRAAWDDLKLGLKHGNEFDRIAIYGKENADHRWQDMATKIGSWFISGEAKYFDTQQSAIKWLDI